MPLRFSENPRPNGLHFSSNSDAALSATGNPAIHMATIGLQGPAGADGAAGAAGGAPTDAQYIVSASNVTLSAERVLTDTATVTWDFSVAGQAKANGASTFTPSALTKTDDTNVTLTLGGTPTTALLQATSVTVGWTGTLAVSRGGIGVGTLTNHGILLGQGTSAIVPTAVMTDGQLLVGQTGADPLPKTLSTDATLSAAGALTIANTVVTYAKIQNVSATSRILGRKTAGAGSTEECTLSQVLDFVGSAADGDILYRTAGAWARLPIGSNTNVLTVASSLPSWAAAAGGSSSMTRRTITSADTMVAGDKANIVEITSGTFSLAYTAAATLGNGWWSIIYNHGTGDVTLDPNGAETIDGLTTWILYPGGAILTQCDGSAFHSVLLAPMRKQFDASGTFTKPGVGTLTQVEGWGGGASGGKGHAAATAAGAGGGGGSAYLSRTILLSSYGTTETITIGAGGTSQTVDSTAGNNGGSTTLGALFTAFGGGKGGDGQNNAEGGGGGGGGTTAIGGAAAGSTPGSGGTPTPNTWGTASGTKDNIYGGARGGGVAGAIGGVSTLGGAGGGGGNTGAGAAGAGGVSIWGGGGGGGSSVSGTAGAAGTSSFGGNGGAGGTGAGNGTAGTQPGGGGGSSQTGNSGAGGDGRLIITIY